LCTKVTYLITYYFSNTRLQRTSTYILHGADPLKISGGKMVKSRRRRRRRRKKKKKKKKKKK
jgi:hypothetical protein